MVDMTDLPVPVPVVAVSPTRDDLVAVLTGLDPGVYYSRDLLPRYLAWAKAVGKRPITAKILGQSMARHFQFPHRSVNGRSAWTITPEAVAGRDWFVEPGKR